MKRTFRLSPGSVIGKIYRNGILQVKDIDYNLQDNKATFDNNIGVPSVFDRHGEEVITIENSISFKVKY